MREHIANSWANTPSFDGVDVEELDPSKGNTTSTVQVHKLIDKFETAV